MPPVFKPSSLSRALLWSIEDTIGFKLLPSVKQRTETSGPVKNSSITMLLPLAPKTLSFIIISMASDASLKSGAIITPFPRANPSAFITIGKSPFLRYSLASSGSEKTS